MHIIAPVSRQLNPMKCLHVGRSRIRHHSRRVFWECLGQSNPHGFRRSAAANPHSSESRPRSVARQGVNQADAVAFCQIDHISWISWISELHHQLARIWVHWTAQIHMFCVVSRYPSSDLGKAANVVSLGLPLGSASEAWSSARSSVVRRKHAFLLIHRHFLSAVCRRLLVAHQRTMPWGRGSSMSGAGKPKGDGQSRYVVPAESVSAWSDSAACLLVPLDLLLTKACRRLPWQRWPLRFTTVDKVDKRELISCGPESQV